MMMSVIGNASSTSVADCRPMLTRFGADAKLASSTEKPVSSATSR